MYAVCWQKSGQQLDQFIDLTTIVSLLEQTITELERFVEVIASERSSLISGDIDLLPSISEKKSALAARLANLESQRDSELRLAGFDKGREGVEAWLSSNLTGIGQSTRKTWTKYLELATIAKRENEINGKLINASLQQNQKALATLMGESGDTATYGADGQTKTSASRRPLGSA